MKLTKLAMVAALACGIYSADTKTSYGNDIQLTGCLSQSSCDCGEPACGCEAIDTGCCDSGCDAGGCDSACGCGSGGCLDGMSGFGSGAISAATDNLWGGLRGECCHGDQWKLFSGTPDNWDIGGWVSSGYHSESVPLFNNRPDEFNLHQAWLYAEKSIDTSDGFDIGGRVDYLYGIDAQDTQAFGINNNHWDNQWDNGSYGHALPQAYLEAGYGDLSVKLGHFYTIIGWEVVGAPGNFFYSHAYTFYNSEPFTHTGALATYNASDDITIWGGYTLGWDSGFEDNGDVFLGGISASVTDDLTLIYAATGGRFNTGDVARELDGDINVGRQGYMHSIIADYALTDSVQYIFQSDLLTADDVSGNRIQETFGINQYLIKTLNDCWAVGARFEWYQNEGVFNEFGDGAADIYALTTGVNYRPNANTIIRPEVRWDWDDDEVAGLDGDDQVGFGIDTIFLF